MRTGDTDNDGRTELLAPRAFAARVCTLVTALRNGEPFDTYTCPQNPLGTGKGPAPPGTDASHYTALYGLYGAGFQDGSAYFMDALHFVQTGPASFNVNVVNTPIINSTQKPTTYASSSSLDLYATGLTDAIVAVGLAIAPKTGGYPSYDSYPFEYPNDPQWGPSALPDGTPVSTFENLGWKYFIAENPGAGDNPDGTPQIPDTLAMVTDGLGAQTVWTYHPLSSKAGRAPTDTPFYSVPGDAASRYIDDRHTYFTSSMPVVSDMASSDGIGGFHTWRYGYTEAMYQLHGRGFQGFRSIIEEDITNGLRTTTRYNQKFPLTSQIDQVTVNALNRVGTDGPLSVTAYTWRCNRASRADAAACTPPNGTATIKFPYLDKKETWTYDSGVALQPTGTPQVIGYVQDVNADDATCAGSFAAASGFDAYGNLTAHTVLSSDSGTGAGGFRPFVASQCQRTRASYTANTSTWWLDRLDSTTTTSAITYNATNHLLPSGVSNPAQMMTVNYLWNADRTLQQQTAQSGLTGEQAITTYAYPASNNYGLPISVSVNASQDGAGIRASGIGYSSDGYFPAALSNPLAQNSSVLTGARDGQPTLTVDANGQRRLMSYDPFGQLIRTQFHGTSDSVLAAPDKFMAMSWCSSLCDPGPQSLYKSTVVQDGAPTSITSYDQLGRSLVVAQRALDGTLPRTLTQYSPRGLVAAQSEPTSGIVSDPVYWTTFQYDALGRVTQKIKPSDASDLRGDLKTTYAYSGRQTAIQVCGTADPNTSNCLNLTRTTDSLGRYMETVDAQGGVTRFWTDANGHTLALVDAKGSVTGAVYNGSGQRLSVTDPNQGTWRFTYDGLGEVLTQTDARNVVTTSTYDKLGRPLTRSVSIDTTGDNVPDAILDSWTYDPLNGVGKPATSQRTVNGAIERRQTFTYDTLARPIQTDTTQQVAVGQTKSYTQTVAYDTYYGRPKSTGYPNGEAVATYYSPYGHPIRSFNPANGFIYRETTAVDVRGEPTVATIGGGVLTDKRIYRASTGDLKQIRTEKAGAMLRELDYNFDLYRNVLVQSLNGASVETYSYDPLMRMTQATRSGAVTGTITYAYDAAGNVTSKSDFSTTAANAYTYTGGVCGGGPNAVKTVATGGGTRSYCFDANGNLTADSAGLSVKYDHDNLAFQTTRGPSTIYLAYGPDNQRTRQWGADGTKVYVDGYEDWISAGSSKVYVGSDAVITTTASTRTVNYLLTDRLGSEDAVADATGNLIET